MIQFLIFLIGALSMLVMVCGAICAIQTIATGEAFLIVVALIFLCAWAWLTYRWLKGKGYETHAWNIYSKIKKH